MEASPPPLSPFLLRNLLFSLAGNSLLSHLSRRSSLLRLLRHLLLSLFLFLLRLFPSDILSHKNVPKSEDYTSASSTGDSAVSRALSQLLTLVTNIPVSSRKYETVRSLAERIIEENLLEGSELLRRVNCTVLSSAFDRTLSQLESAVLHQGGPIEDVGFGAGRVMRAVKYCGDVVWGRFGASGVGESGEKLSAEALWLAQKMAACGCVDEAVWKWGSAKRLAWLALSAEPGLQCSLVKVSAFLFKHAKDLGQDDDEEEKKEKHRRTKLRMLISWLPLLCSASNGTDTPVMSMSEKTELERVLEDIIDTLDEEEEQEKVLSLWLHHFTYCPSSDWPNLHACYSRWCVTSRKRLLLQ